MKLISMATLLDEIENPFDIGVATLLDEIEYPFEIGAATLRMKLSIPVKWEQPLHGSLDSSTYSWNSGQTLVRLLMVQSFCICC